MLRERILPVGMGHTTNCFLQVKLDFHNVYLKGVMLNDLD